MRFKIIIALIISFSIFSTISYILGYRLNLSSSIPPGIYKLDKKATYTKGDLVIFCLSEKEAKYAKMKGYIGMGIVCPAFSVPLTKYITAAAGDSISIDSDIIINGKDVLNSVVLKTDHEGHQTKRIKYHNRILKEDEYILFSNYNPNSYDSRYYGIIHHNQIIGKSSPIITW